MITNTLYNVTATYTQVDITNIESYTTNSIYTQ